VRVGMGVGTSIRRSKWSSKLERYPDVKHAIGIFCIECM
jgi:hypothetical protein